MRLGMIMPWEEICTRFSTWRERTPGDPLVRSEYYSVVWRGGFNLSAKQHSLITNNRLQGMGYLIGHHNPLTSFPHFVKSCRTTWVLAVTLPGSNYWWMSQWVKYGLRSKCKCLRWPHTHLGQMKNSSSQQAKPILQSSSLANRCLRSSRIQPIQAGRIRWVSWLLG